MSVKMTKKQLVVYDFIKEFIAENGYSPSMRDIQSGIGLSSVSAVAEHINNLVALGALKKSPGAARSLEVVDLSFPETTALFKQKIQTVPEDQQEILKQAAAILGIDLIGEEA